MGAVSVFVQKQRPTKKQFFPEKNSRKKPPPALPRFRVLRAPFLTERLQRRYSALPFFTRVFLRRQILSRTGKVPWQER